MLKIRKALDKANRVVESAVDDVVADDIKAAAKEADEKDQGRRELSRPKPQG